MQLDKFPRRKYTSYKTPITKLKRLSGLINKANLYIKRDDQLDLAGGGNKTRKLEFVLGHALKNQADTLITCGGLQSNHCRLTAAAAVREGLKCRLILIKEPHQEYDPLAGGNNLLYHLLGVESITIIHDEKDLDQAMQLEAARVLEAGGSPCLIPIGASNPVGTRGYMACAREILEQSQDMGLHFDYIITPSGSCGTQAGLLIGMHLLDYDCQILGMNVSRSKEAQKALMRILVDQTISDHNFPAIIPDEKILCFDKSVGDGYAIPSAEMVKTVKLLASTEGILLDPVYTGKAMVGLLDLLQKDYFPTNANILFIHTGGTPALYSSPEIFIP